MPARDATEDAVALLEKRRAQNRQAQARFRQKKLAQQAAAAAAAAGSSSGSSSAPSAASGSSAADATNGKRRRASPPVAPGAQPQVVYRGGSTSSESGYAGNSSTSPSSSRSGPESDKASSPSTSSSSTSPSSGSSSALSPSSYFASLPSAGAPQTQTQSSGLPVFSYPEATPKPPSTLDSTTACPYAGIDLSLPGALPLPADRTTTYASYDDYLGDTISSSSAMPVDNEVQYFACVMREAEEEQRRERERKEMLLQRQQMMLQQFPQRQVGGGMAYGGLDDLLMGFEVGTGTGTTLAPGLLEQGAPSSGTGFFDQQQQAQQPQPQPPQPQQPQPSSFSGMDLSFTGLTPWQITEQLTQEKGMLAMALLQSGAPNIEQLRKAVLDPSRSMKFNESHVMAKAFFHNAVTLGFLDSDLRAHHAQSNIADVWKARSVPFVVAPSMGGLAVLNGSSTAISPRNLAAPGTLTKTSDELWRMPIALSQTDEERRIDRLRDAPNMFPTALQLTRPHSMIVDVLPWPSVRDGLIRLLDLGIVDSHTLKCDLLGKPFDCQGDGRTFIIHGNDPLDPEAWEMSEYWAQKYVPLLDRAMVRRTNFWRRMEGKEPLRLDVDREEGVDRSIIDALAKLNMAGGGGAPMTTTTMGPMPTSLCV